MKYTVNYNNSNGREFANVTFENGNTCSFEIMKSRPRTAKEAFRNEADYSFSQCSGRVQDGMRVVFDSFIGSIDFEEILENNLSEKFEHNTFGKCEVISTNDQFTKITVLKTGERKTIFTQILLKNIK